MLTVDDPNTGVGAKAVDVGAAKSLPAVAVAVGPPTEPAPLLTVPKATPKGLAALETLLNRPPALVADVEESLGDGLATVVVAVGDRTEVNGEPPVGAEAFVGAGVMLGKNGLAVLVAEKADAVPVDKLNILPVTVVVGGVVVLDLAPPRETSNKPAGENAGVVAGAPKMLPETGSVLVAVVDDTMLDLLLSDKACAKMPPALADTGKPDSVITVGVLVSLCSDGVPLEGRETWPGSALEVDAGSLEAAAGAAPSKLPVLTAGPPGADARIKELKMLGGLLLVSPPLPNTLPVVVAVER